MFRGFSDEECIWSIEESVEVFMELIFIEVFEAFAVVLTVIGELIDS